MSEGIETQSKAHKCMSRPLFDDFVVVSYASGEPWDQRSGKTQGHFNVGYEGCARQFVTIIYPMTPFLLFSVTKPMFL